MATTYGTVITNAGAALIAECILNGTKLPITEAAVGAGITGILFFLTLRRINLIDKDAEHEARREEDHHDDTL